MKNKNSKALVTLAIGQRYLKQWKNLCQANWQKYADKHGYDVICIDTPLDESERGKQRSPAWQKCLILSQEFAQKYERIVWIDSDILINSSIAPCIVKGVSVEKVGAVDAWSSPTVEFYAKALERKLEFWSSYDRNVQDYYANWGLPPKFYRVVQTGVMVHDLEG